MAHGKQVVVVGAGVAGLAAAHELARAGARVTVLEQRDEVGGLARSMTVQGARMDCYYHFVCGGDDHLKELAAELGISDRLHWGPAPTSYYFSGHLYPFTTPWDILRFSPVPLAGRLRFGLHAAHARRFSDWSRIEHLTAEEWLVAGAGRAAYEAIWAPLLRMKFGETAGGVSAPWIWHRMHRVATSRESLLKPEQFGCFEEGTWTLLSALVEHIRAAGGEVHTGRPVRALLEREGRVAGVVTDEGDVEADAVISTAPLPALVPLLPPAATEYAAQLSAVEFVGVVCLLARLRNPVTESFWVNVNDPRAPFQGFVEYTNLYPGGKVGDARLLYIPLYMPVEDPRFVMPQEALAEMLLTGLETLFPGFSRDEVLDWTVTRDSYAQAICPPGFSERVPAPAAPIPGLFITDSTQLYPADRNVSGAIGLARQAARLCLGE